ncbi:SEC-C metal-binding domain-containing protein [Mediterraneibacter glycyrrhizinilyticus]|nr:SEC-C metal-binding domain-containing protein [Mediterraneibacter glycyrrhizinilyticus]MDM8126632.1 SEC-C metal-binding domain-containing protein [Mediterraneibacter glycyrrhizinilyticus]
MRKQKIGRNDPCPCDSGKKYKFCCMNKPKAPVDDIESPEERRRWLERYPAAGRERIPGRVYLEDYYDRDSIEADKLLYLGLMHRPGLIWKRDEQKENQRTREYLYLAFQEASEIAEREKLTSLEKFDKKHGIHYRCAEWLGRLLELLKDAGDQERYDEVRNWIQTMREED